MYSNRLKKINEQIGTPFFVYNQQILNKNIDRIFEVAKKVDLGNRIFIFLSYFANSNPNIIKRITNSKIGVLLQTQEEYYHLQKFDVDSSIVVSPSFLSNQEIDFWAEKNITVNLASLEEVRYWINKYNSPMSFRMDLTFWQNQRTGIKKRQLKELAGLLKKAKITPKSIHVYCGTGSDINKIKKYLNKTIKTYKKYFPDVKEVNLGGGFGFSYEKTNIEVKHFD